jgi:F0F1-type ATP synthase assembly protein I
MPGAANRPPAPGPAQLLQLGATCGVCIGVGALGGYLLDRDFGTSPLLVLVGLVIGIFGAATGSFYLIRPYVSDASRLRGSGSRGGGAPTPKE